MYYEINVSLNGVHFFATAPRSLTTLSHCTRVYDELRQALTPEKGYEIMVRQWDTVGTRVDMSDPRDD